VSTRRTLQDAALLEAQRSAGSFSLVRISPAGVRANGGELRAVETVVKALVRRTDVVARFEERELGVELPDVVEAEQVVERLRKELERKMPGVDLRIGWGAVGPGHEPSWREGWRWAGQLAVADGAIRAAA